LKQKKKVNESDLKRAGILNGQKRAVLLDLDGVVVRLVDHGGEFGVSPRLEHEIILVDDLEKSLEKLVEAGFLIIGITNQPDISRKKITEQFLVRKHQLIQKQYPQISEIMTCTHTETDLCDCRKPKPGLLKRAAKKHNLDLALCWMVGDARSDVEAGSLVHARTIFIQNKYNCADPAIAACTAVAKSTAGALKLIAALESGESNKSDA
jgi:D-glycero-D-manno-heptose 1,7-bisphosphate phosphatase